MKKPLITFDHFTFQYHSQAEPTLRDISVTIYEGEKVAIIGPSGSGKSTFSKCINGLIPTRDQGEMRGEVRICGKNLAQTDVFALSFDVGTVLQDTDGQFIGLTVGEDIAFALENDGASHETMQQEVKKWANLVGLPTLLTQRPQDLSGGQKQRVAMAGVLIDQSPILLFDEPFANLDPKTGKETIALIHQLHQQKATTTLIIEHRLEDVLHRPVDRILVFHEGRLIANTTPDELLKTDLLPTIGLREPLYITAMKYAKINLAPFVQLTDCTKLHMPTLNEQMTAWQQMLPAAVLDHSEKEALLSLTHLSYRYAPHAPLILNDLSLTFYQGEMVSIVGANGAGKSTLSQLICGFLPMQEGKMTWKKTNFAALSIAERAKKVGFVLQNPNKMISQKTVEEEVSFGLQLKGIAPEEIKTRVNRMLHICGLAAYRQWPIAALSFGQKKRVTIAAILVEEPDLLLLDEPTAGQDFRHANEIMTFLESLKALGITIVMITHDMHLMLEHTQRTIVMCQGKILADTTPVQVLTNPTLVEQAALKETSLFTFANAIQLADPLLFVKDFITYDREVRKK